MFTLKSYAKINLSLDIGGRLLNGYHILSSIVSYVNLYDIIRIAPNKDDDNQLSINGEFGNHLDISYKYDNNILKTMYYMQKKYKIKTNFHVRLQKNIPIGSGMGGGSSNASAIIRFINQYIGLNLSDAEIKSDANMMGSDMQFFMQNNLAVCEDTGTSVFPIYVDWGNTYVLLINPMISLSTKKVYEKLRAQNIEKIIDPQYAILKEKKFISAKDMLTFISKHNNDLTLYASSLRPEINNIIEEIQNYGVEIARMSGSGSTCFALSSNQELLLGLAAHMRQKYPLFFIKYLKMINNIEHQSIAARSYGIRCNVA